MPMGEARNAWVAANSLPPAPTVTSQQTSRIEPTANAMPVSRCRMDSAEVIWKRYQVGNMKGDNGRSIGSSGRFSNSMLTNLPRCTMSLGAETAQQLHHVVFMFCRRITNAEDPIKQVGVRAIEQRLEPPELIVVQGREGVLGERPENEVAFLRPAMPAPKQQALAADIRMFVICGLRSSMFHRLFSMSLLRTAAADAIRSPPPTINAPSANA